MLQRLFCWLFGHKTVIWCYSRNTGTMDSIIEPGEEITYDYSVTIPNDDWVIPRTCGSTICTRCCKKVHAD